MSPWIQVLIAAALAGFPGSPAPAAATEWNLLADQVIARGGDRAVIRIDPKLGPLSRVRVDPRGGDVMIHEVRAIYADGSSETLAANLEVRVGDPSPVLQIAQDRGAVRELVIAIEALPGAPGRVLFAAFGEIPAAGAR